MIEPQIIREVWMTHHISEFMTEERFSQIVQKMDINPVEVYLAINRFVFEEGNKYAHMVFNLFDVDSVVTELAGFRWVRE
jgi:hypothetical protein